MIVRLFRKYIKEGDTYLYNDIEPLFTSTKFNFSVDTFNQNLALFEELTACKRLNKAESEIQGLVKKIFKSSPSKNNLKELF